MKLKYRPMAIMGFSSLFVLFVCAHFDDRFSFVSIGAGIIILLLTAFIRNFRESVTPFFVAAALIFSGISFEMTTDYKISYADSLTDKEVTLDATVLEEPDFTGTKYYYTLMTNRIDGKDFKVKLRLSASQYIDTEPYDRIRFKVTLYEIGSFSRDIKLYYNSKGIFLGGYVSNYDDDYPIEITKPERKPLGYYLYEIRKTVTNRILDGLPNDYGGVGIGMLIGDKSYISDETMGYIKGAGVAPVFAVSGMHLSVWVMGLYAVLEELKVRKKINSSIGIGFTLFFMAVTGLTPSVCRAGIMLIMILIGNLFHRKADPINSLGFAALLLGIINPLITADIGFLLSFSSTLGIIAVNPLLEKHVVSKIKDSIWGKIAKSVLRLFFVSACATFASLGFVIVFISYISVYSIISNMLIGYAAVLCMLTCGLTVLFYPFGSLRAVFSLESGLIARYIIAVIKFISGLPFATVRTDNEYWVYGAIVFYTLIIGAVLIFNNRRAFKISSVGLAAVILTCCLLYHFDYDGYNFLRVLDTDGCVAAVLSDGEHNVVICSDGDYKYLSDSVSDALMGSDGETDLMIADINGGYSSVYGLIGESKINKLIVSQKNDSLLSVYDEKNITENSNAKIKLWKDTTVKFFSADEYSVAVCDIDGVNITIILREGKIPQNFLTGDILICDDVPENINFKKIIVSGESDSENSISTEVYGDMDIKIKKSNYKIFIREGN